MDNSVIWIGVSFAYKGLLQILAIFLAFHIRRVKIQALNDSKEIAAIIYINSIILTVLAITQFVLEQKYHNAHAALFGLALLVQPTLFLGILFIPKVSGHRSVLQKNVRPDIIIILFIDDRSVQRS